MKEGMESYTPPEGGTAEHRTISVSEEQITAMAAKSGDTPEHIREMLGIAEGVTTAGSEPKLAGKYADDGALQQGLDNLTTKLNLSKEDVGKVVDALGPEDAYKHFESKLGKQDADNKDSGNAADGNDGSTENKSEKAGPKDALSGDEDDGGNSEFDIHKFTKEFTESGKLSDDSYKELQDAGIPKNVVDEFIKAYGAHEELFNMRVNEYVGGKDKYDSLINWASANLSQPEKERFNSSLDGNDLEQAKPMLDALMARYERAEGTMSRQSVDSSGAGSGQNVAGYQSSQAMQSDMRDPRYKSDPAFRALVMSRIKYSKVL